MMGFRIEHSDYAKRHWRMETLSLLAVACAEEVTDPAKPMGKWSLQEHKVAGELGIVFW